MKHKKHRKTRSLSVIFILSALFIVAVLLLNSSGKPKPVTAEKSAAIPEADVSSPDEAASWLMPQAENCLLTDEERSQLQSTAMSAAEVIKELYAECEITDGTSFSSNITDFSREQREKAVELLGGAGYTAVTDGMNMVNYKSVFDFYSDYVCGQESQTTVFKVNDDGLLSSLTFVYRNERLQTFCIGIGWLAGGEPIIKSVQVSDISEMRMTDKGYLIYAYQNEVMYSSLRQYLHISPLSDKCRGLTEKYISGISYINYSLLTSEWDSVSIADVLNVTMFDDLYRKYYGEDYVCENDRIPSDIFENVMLSFFPLTAEQLRESCGYDAADSAYPHELPPSKPYQPFGEVIDYTENSDGTITLTVDCVWADYDTDRAFTNIITVRPNADGTFTYLSNKILEGEIDIPK
ncbi:MAG: DUF6070 family protein [Clostridia bacterium]|nr:DUF6070 family protein [Clostridia bacterium]